MSMLVQSSFKSSTLVEDFDTAVMQFIKCLSELPAGQKIKVTVEVLEDIAQMKKKYFAMVVALGKEAGYISHKEKEQFKKQVRDQMQIKSIEEITTKQEMCTVIEALYQLAAEHYNYKFDDVKPIDILFPTGESEKE